MQILSAGVRPANPTRIPAVWAFIMNVAESHRWLAFEWLRRATSIERRRP